MFNLIQRRRSEDGASAVEYGLLVAAIAAIIVVIVFALGRLVRDGFGDTCDAMKTGTGDTVTDCGTTTPPAVSTP